MNESNQYLTNSEIMQYSKDDDLFVEKVIRPIAERVASLFFPSIKGDDRDDLICEALTRCWNRKDQIDDRNAFSFLTQQCRWSMTDVVRQIQTSKKNSAQLIAMAEEGEVKAYIIQERRA